MSGKSTKAIIMELIAFFLILAILDDENARRFYHLAKELCLDVIVEVHDIYELRRAVKLKSSCIGINNRNF